MPAVSSRSFAPQGMPCNGPRYLPAAISSSALSGLLDRQLPRDRDDAAQLGIELLQPIEIDLVSRSERSFFALDPSRELGQRREGNVLVACRQWPWIGLAADKSIAFRAGLLPRQHRVPARPRRQLRIQRHLARPCAAFVQRRHRFAPAICSYARARAPLNSTSRVFRLPRMWRVTPRVQRPVQCRTRAVLREAGWRAAVRCSDSPRSRPVGRQTRVSRIAFAISTCFLRTAL